MSAAGAPVAVSIAGNCGPGYRAGIAGYCSFNCADGSSVADTAQLRHVRAGSVGEFGNFFREDADRRWTPENPNAEGPRAWNRSDPYWAQQANTYFLRDAKYLRLKAATIGFTVPEAWLQRFSRMQSLQVYLTGRNLLTWSPLKIMDPEIRNQAAHEYPPERAFTLGLRMGF